MYETEALWREKRKGEAAPGIGSVFKWLLRIGAVGAFGLFVIFGITSLPGTRDRAASEPATSSAQAAAPDAKAGGGEKMERQLVLRRAANGHFKVRAYVNGVSIPFLVDTGASDVALSAEAARQIGINMDSLKYTRRYQTANGTIYAAPVNLRDVRIGDLRVYDVDASITKSDLGVSLLGMSFLNRLTSFEVRGGELILRW